MLAVTIIVIPATTDLHHLMILPGGGGNDIFYLTLIVSLLSLFIMDLSIYIAVQ